MQWHRHVEKSFEDHPTATKAWALFSYGGWSDNGQLWFFEGDKNGFYVGPNQKTHKTFPLPKDKHSEIVTKLSALPQLPDLMPTPPIFDALEYEFVAWKKIKGKQICITHRSYMMDPQILRERMTIQAHQDLIDLFGKLKPKKK